MPNPGLAAYPEAQTAQSSISDTVVYNLPVAVVEKVNIKEMGKDHPGRSVTPIVNAWLLVFICDIGNVGWIAGLPLVRM